MLEFFSTQIAAASLDVKQPDLSDRASRHHLESEKKNHRQKISTLRTTAQQRVAPNSTRPAKRDWC